LKSALSRMDSRVEGKNGAARGMAQDRLRPLAGIKTGMCKIPPYWVKIRTARGRTLNSMRKTGKIAPWGHRASGTWFAAFPVPEAIMNVLSMGRCALGAVFILSMPAVIRAQPSVRILQNGVVHPHPAYPYMGHKYDFEVSPGDNDMPWLRQFALDHAIFAHIDMTLDWKDREFDMMKAIVWYTSHHLSWTGESTFSDVRHRAKTILELNEQWADLSWICEDISFAAVGLAQCVGIPARAVGGRTQELSPDADMLVEMYSTRYNRWILFFQKCYGWIEHQTDGPLGMRELQQYDRTRPIRVWWKTDHWEALPHPPLVFMPLAEQTAPIWPYLSERWNTQMYQLVAYTWRNMPNGTYPDCCPGGPSVLYLANDEYLNEQNEYLGWGWAPVVPLDSADANYPLNNVEISAIVRADGARISLINNMFEFLNYEISEDGGAWVSLPPPNPEEPVLAASTYIWRPGEYSFLTIRGVNKAGVRSPDVLVEFRPAPPNGDLNADGHVDGLDLAAFLKAMGDSQPEQLFHGDFDADRALGIGDIPGLVQALLN